jgi:hypothetical protein
MNNFKKYIFPTGRQHLFLGLQHLFWGCNTYIWGCNTYIWGCNTYFWGCNTYFWAATPIFGAATPILGTAEQLLQIDCVHNACYSEGPCTHSCTKQLVTAILIIIEGQFQIF